MAPIALSAFRLNTDRWLARAIETVVLALVVLSPWAFASVEPLFEWGLDAGVALLLFLWGARMLCQGEFRWKKSPLALCLAALILLAAFQMQSLPSWLLKALSPNAAKLYADLLPASPEVLPGGEICVPPPLAAGKSISLYPGATRREMFRLLAVFLVFAVVTNNIDPTKGLRRLSLALVLNGSALAFFALLQYLTSPPNVVYWTYQTQGRGFGPFISRSHYPFYVNVCIGSGIGLLLAMFARDRRDLKSDGTWQSAARRFLEDPRRMWLGFGVALMTCSVLVSLSRGGLLSLIVAFAALILFLKPNRSERRNWLIGGLVAGVLVVGLVAWVGGSAVVDRTETILKGEALEQSRMAVWSDSWPLVGEFPIFGTGFGTYRFAEPLHRVQVSYIFYQPHAHNEYLQAMIEGGVVHLTIALLAIFLVFRAGFRAVKRYSGRSAGGLAIGALFGFTAFVVHSIGDFGVHLPAIALLITVLVAELVSLSGIERESTSKGDQEAADPESDSYVLRLGGVAPALGAATVALLGLALFFDGLQAQRAQAARLLATDLRNHPTESARLRQTALLEAAVRSAPYVAALRTELAQAYLDRFTEEQARLERTRQAATVTQLLIAGAPFPLGMLVQGPPLGPLFTAEFGRNAKENLVPALHAYVQARDLNPLMPVPHSRIASQVPYFAKADPRTAYLNRAKRLQSLDPDLWFLSGFQELMDGHRDQAAQSWHRCLELSEQRLGEILDLGKTAFSAQALVDQVLPDRPHLLFTAASKLFSQSEDNQKKLLERALAVLGNQPVPLAAEDLHLQAQIQARIGKPAEAIETYRQALEKEPKRSAWRMEMAELLHAQGRRAEGREELIFILRQQPTEAKALRLLKDWDGKVD